MDCILKISQQFSKNTIIYLKFHEIIRIDFDLKKLCQKNYIYQETYSASQAKAFNTLM